MKHIDKRKVIGTVIGLVFFISCLAYFTYAWYEWRSGNNTVNLTIKDASIECTSGPDINVENIGPILNLKDGVKANFSIKNGVSNEVNITLGLNITSISSSLRTDSFKWALFQDTTGTNNFDYGKAPLLSGNFSNLGIKENTLSSTIKVAGNSTYSFMFIVYIDGNMENSESMMSGSMKATITYGDCGTTTTKQYLNTVSPGSYVKYTGNNGCTDKACEGQKANYVSDDDMDIVLILIINSTLLVGELLIFLMEVLILHQGVLLNVCVQIQQEMQEQIAVILIQQPELPNT